MNSNSLAYSVSNYCSNNPNSIPNDGVLLSLSADFHVYKGAGINNKSNNGSPGKNRSSSNTINS